MISISMNPSKEQHHLFGPWRTLEVPVECKESTRAKLVSLGMEVDQYCPLARENPRQCIITFRKPLETGDGTS